MWLAKWAFFGHKFGFYRASPPKRESERGLCPLTMSGASHTLGSVATKIAQSAENFCHWYGIF